MLPASDQQIYRTPSLLIHTGRVWCGDRTHLVAKFIAKYRTYPVTIPDASGRPWMLTILDRTLRLSVRSVSNRCVRSALEAYWTRPDSAAQRSVICSSAFGLSVRSHESVGYNGYLILNWTRGGLGETGRVRSSYRTCPIFTTGASGATSGRLDRSVRSMRSQPNN